MKNVQLFYCLLIVLCAISGCNKDDADCKTETKAELIAGKNWVLTALTSKNNNEPTVDRFVEVEVCRKDDIIRFDQNGTYESNEGATKCSPADPQISEQGTWSITAEDDLITTATDTSISDTVRITELTESKLVLSSTYTSLDDTSVTVVTFTAQ